MTFLDDAKYYAAIIHAAKKYNVYGINVAEEYDRIEEMEEEIKYNVTKTDIDELVLTNRVFFFRHIVIKLCRFELGSDANLELFKFIIDLYNTFGEVVVRCHNKDDERYDYIDDLAFKKNQIEFMLNNAKENTRLIYNLMMFELEYIVGKYCSREFIETKGDN